MFPGACAVCVGDLISVGQSIMAQEASKEWDFCGGREWFQSGSSADGKDWFDVNPCVSRLAALPAPPAKILPSQPVIFSALRT